MPYELKAEPRKELGRKARTLRKKGFLPAVLYGEKIASQPLSVPVSDFMKVYQAAGESSLITLKVSENIYNVLIHDIASDPIKNDPIHADFYAVRMDKEIHADIPLVFAGESLAVKNEGGVLVKVVQEIEVSALPKDLPHEISVDISTLVSFADRITVRNLFVPQGVKIKAEPDEVIALVKSPRSDEELEELKQAPTAEAPEEVKTEQELKKEKIAAEAGEEIDSQEKTSQKESEKPQK